MENLVRRLQQHALPDPHDEREVLHAPLLREAADRIRELEAELDLRTKTAHRYAEEYQRLKDELAELKKGE